MIIVINLTDASKRVLVDYGNGKNRKGEGVWFNSINLDDNIKAALVRFHAFTGNDYVWLIFKRGKQGCFKVMKVWWIYQWFQIAWRGLGVKCRTHSCIGKFRMSFILTQRYRYQQSLKANVWLKVCERRKSHRSITFATLPVDIISAHLALQLCRMDLEMFFTQCSRVPKHHGWMENGGIVWVDDAFPDNIVDILVEEILMKEASNLN